MVFDSPDRNAPHGPPLLRGVRRRAARAIARPQPHFEWIVAAILFLIATRVWTSPARPQDAGAPGEGTAAGPAGAAPSPVRAATVAPTPPSDLRHLDAWIEYRSRAHIPMLADPARVFYRRGLLAWRSGQDSEAVRLVRGAAILDPTYAAPHGTLAAWYLTREPSEALQQAAALLQILKRDFLLQLAAAGNAGFLLVQTLFYALLGLGMLLILHHQSELRHMWQERLQRTVSPVSARTWAWASSTR